MLRDLLRMEGILVGRYGHVKEMRAVLERWAADLAVDELQATHLRVAA